MIPSKALAAVTPNELSRSATLFTIIKQLRLKVTSISNQNNDINQSTNIINEEVLDEAFESHIQSVLEKLDSRLPNINEESIKQAEIIMARHGLFDAAFQQAILLCLAIFPALGNSLKDIRAIHSTFISDLYQVIESTNNDNIYLSNELHNTQQNLNDVENDNKKLLDAVQSLDKEAEDQKHLILDLRQQIRELSTKLSVYENVTNDNSEKFSDQLPLAFNKPLTTASRNTTPLRSSRSKERHLDKSVDSKSNRSVDRSVDRSLDNRTSIRSTNTMTSNPSKNPYIKTYDWLMSYRADIQSRIDSKSYRFLTVNECIDSIDKIYDSKLLSNERAKESEPMETLEQHVYQFYEKKYGLRQLAIENIARLLYTCNHYSKENNSIEVFLKIFHNEIEEDYLLVQKELIKSIHDLLMLQIMTRNPTKDQATLQHLLSDKTSNYIYIDEYLDILNYLYDPIDSKIVINQINELATQEMTINKQKNEKNELDKSPLNKLLYNQKKLNEYSSNSVDDNKVDNDVPVVIKNIAGNKYNPPITSSGSPHPPANILDSKRLGYVSPTVNATNNKYNYQFIDIPKPIITDPIPVKLSNISNNQNNNSNNNSSIYLTNNSKINLKKLKILFSNFLLHILKYQLDNHINYLNQFRLLFNKYDDNHDGIVTIEQFYYIYIDIQSLSINSSNNSSTKSGIQINTPDDKLEIFKMLVKLIDPFEYDIITYSSAIHVLNKIGLKMK